MKSPVQYYVPILLAQFNCDMPLNGFPGATKLPLTNGLVYVFENLISGTPLLPRLTILQQPFLPNVPEIRFESKITSGSRFFMECFTIKDSFDAGDNYLGCKVTSLFVKIRRRHFLATFAMLSAKVFDNFDFTSILAWIVSVSNGGVARA